MSENMVLDESNQSSTNNKKNKTFSVASILSIVYSLINGALWIISICVWDYIDKFNTGSGFVLQSFLESHSGLYTLISITDTNLFITWITGPLFFIIMLADIITAKKNRKRIIVDVILIAIITIITIANVITLLSGF